MPAPEVNQGQKENDDARNIIYEKQFLQLVATKIKHIIKLPQKMDNTPVQSTGRPYNDSPPPTLQCKDK